MIKCFRENSIKVCMSVLHVLIERMSYVKEVCKYFEQFSLFVWHNTKYSMTNTSHGMSNYYWTALFCYSFIHSFKERTLHLRMCIIIIQDRLLLLFVGRISP